eukprot:GEZU01026896.1.p1 GENE.GEZU01026896.1~~GEZU01026896.1.p1  ORF type:complete len:136 (-),score=1.98 GEZU01026896.1:86-493(-)
MYYKNSAATMPAYSEMWSGYRAVYHANAAMRDSSPSGNNLTGSGSYTTGVTGHCLVLVDDDQFSRPASYVAGTKSVAFWQFANGCSYYGKSGWYRATAFGTVIETFVPRKCNMAPYQVEFNNVVWEPLPVGSPGV